MNNISIICFLTAPSLLVFGLMLCVGWWFLAFFHLIFACMPCYLVVHICSWRTYVIVFKWSSWHLSWLFGRSSIHGFATTKDVFALQTRPWGSARSSDLVDIYLDYLEEVQFTGLLQQKMYLLYRPGLGGVQGAQPGWVFKCYGPQTKNQV